MTERRGHFFHVTHSKSDDKWYVREVKWKDSATLAFNSKDEATKKAEELAKKVEMGHVVIHDERGKFETVENF
ncbi:MAG: DUF2188 domain-containing protein [Candidatus Cardinium sp.]|uniref:DUF2188 domain-containing protein n=1 Tax=Cardinium endosymbiont of Dermatophagoides farinae TaxID=2597823 RepID=UPI00118254D7|nr:DUF2188 domain-containing protein [Cardinium endosymbiont of Dermatophagoides farinae]TSJ80762.1 DUF2188 domain-containing protein [Cardinium endosymbiont of Dermatophagoides farinae]UWW96760.1 MAG: DUF2188 domain-containing protein [Candidatus Cardinium sp.]